MKTLNQTLSVVLSVALVAGTLPAHAASPAQGPAFLNTFTPSPRLGFVVDHFQGTSKQPIVLIQDLHANYGVQKKITNILASFKDALTPNGQPMYLGREAAWTEVDMSPLMSKPEVERNARAEALLKNAYISAEEYFAAKNPNVPTHIVGIENEADFALHDRLTKASFAARMRLAGKVETLQATIQQAKLKAPSDLKRVWKAEDNYLNGTIGLDELARRLHLETLDYNSTEKTLLDRKLALAENAGKDAGYYKNLVLADHYLSLLTRLFRQQMTIEEVRYAYQNSSDMLAVIGAMLPGENMTQWADVLRSAVDFYAVALLRDKPLAENSMKLAADHADQPVAVVTGGFHTEGITNILRSKGISFVVIAPVVESNTLHDEMLYLERSLGVPGDAAQFSKDVKAATVHTKGIQPDLQGPVDPNAGNKNGGAIDAMSAVDMSVPELKDAPALVDSNKSLQGVLDSQIEIAKGFGLLDPATLAKVTFVISPNRTSERTWYDAQKDHYTVNISPKKLEKIQSAAAAHGTGSAEYANAVNEFVFRDLNKVRSNVTHQNIGEMVTTSDAVQAIFAVKNISRRAIGEAFASVDGELFSPFNSIVSHIVDAMNHDAIEETPEAQAAWFAQKENQQFLSVLVAAAISVMNSEYGIKYADTDRIIKELQSTQEGLLARGKGPLGIGQGKIRDVVAQASTFLRISNPTEAQTKEMRDAVNAALNYSA